jgi:hypothetical protein
VDDASRKRGELRVPILPAVLWTPASSEPPPQLPVLSGPVSRRRRRGKSRVGLGVWLGLAAAGVAVGATALVLAQSSGDHTAASNPPAHTVSTPAAAKPPPAAAKSSASPGPFRVVAVHEPAGVVAAAAASGALLLGRGGTWVVGGESAGQPVDTIARVVGGRAQSAGAFEEPLAEAGYAGAGTSLYLAGGFTGTKYATAVLRLTPPSGSAVVVARLPTAVRAPAVALLGKRLYVAGGRTPAGATRSLTVVDLGTGTVHALARLPRPVSDAALVPVGGRLYLLAGKSVLRIDPATGAAVAAGKLPARLHGAVSLGSGGLVVAGGHAYRLT